MHIYYITATYPYGNGESFLEEEIISLLEYGHSVTIVPRSIKGKVRKSFLKLHTKSNLSLLAKSILDFEIIKVFTKFFLGSPLKLIKQISIIMKSPKKIHKNLFVLPKSTWLADKITKDNVDHVHVHWGGTTSSMVLLAGVIQDFQWSITCHRWDIYENNLLKIKSEKSKFMRLISDKGKIDVCKFGALDYKSFVIHMGVSVEDNIEIPIKNNNNEIFRILCPANLIEVKGHKYLIQATQLLKEKGVRDFKIDIAGEGELKSEILDLIKKLDVENNFNFLGQIPHDELIAQLKDGQYNLVVLPSVDLGKGLHEGIPVSLMEAMSYGIPVISTKTGSIPDLVNEFSGILVDEKNPIQICSQIIKLMYDDIYFKEKSSNGYFYVKKYFSIKKNVEKLINMINN